MAAAQAGLPVRLESVGGGKFSTRERRESQAGSGICPVCQQSLKLKRDNALKSWCAESTALSKNTLEKAAVNSKTQHSFLKRFAKACSPYDKSDNYKV